MGLKQGIQYKGSYSQDLKVVLLKITENQHNDVYLISKILENSHKSWADQSILYFSMQIKQVKILRQFLNRKMK